jgi:hypothetical protein
VHGTSLSGGAIQTAVQAAIVAYYLTVPIGGLPGQVQGLQQSEMIAMLFAAFPYIKNITAFTLNGGLDVVLAGSEIPTAAAPATVTVMFA